MTTDAVGSLDQLGAMLRDLADTLAAFRSALVEKGFHEGTADDLVGVWFESFVSKRVEDE